MLLLASTSDALSIITSSTSALDVHASYVDLSGTNVTPGRTNTAISSAATTTVVAAPAANTVRSIKSLAARNKGSASQTVTVRHTDGTTICEIIEAILAADFSLNYLENAGWWVADSNGRPVHSSFPGGGIVASDSDTIVVLGSDVTNNNASANTIADVTGLSFAVTQDKLYWFRFDIVYTAAATTTGSRWSINGPTTTYLNYYSHYSLTTTTRTDNTFLQAYDVPAASNATSAATGNNWARIEGVIQPSAGGTLIARFASEVSGSAIVAKINSYVRYRQITA